MLAPNTAPNMMASSNAGNASSRSLVRMMNSLGHRRAIAARIPSGTPITAATPTATTPTNNVVRDPTMIWLNTSRPNLSVPNQWSHDGLASRTVGSTSVASYGVQTNETSAISAMSPTITAPTIRLGFSRLIATPAAGGPARRTGDRPGS